MNLILNLLLNTLNLHLNKWIFAIIDIKVDKQLITKSDTIISNNFNIFIKLPNLMI